LQAIAEVVSSSVTSFIAQSLAQDDSLSFAGNARFGSFVTTESPGSDLKIIGVVHDVVTGPIDGVHRTSAFGLTREQLRLEQPQIFALLRTELHTVIIGFQQGGKTFQYLPPRPPEIHDFVFAANRKEIEAVTHDFEFLRLLAAVTTVPADELIAAAVREAYSVKGKDQLFLLKAGQTLSQLFRSDYERLVSVLRKIRPAENQ
jgi:hypothetical protein